MEMLWLSLLSLLTLVEPLPLGPQGFPTQQQHAELSEVDRKFAQVFTPCPVCPGDVRRIVQCIHMDFIDWSFTAHELAKQDVVAVWLGSG